MKHFADTHSRSEDGRFITPLPKRVNTPNIGESRSQAVRRFLNLERSLHNSLQFTNFAEVIEEYLSLGHAEEVPIFDLQKPPEEVFYMPMHACRVQALEHDHKNQSRFRCQPKPEFYH